MRKSKMMVRAATALLTTFLVLGLGDANAAEEGDEQRHGGWQFEATPYFWLPAVDGTVSIGGASADMDIGIDDILDAFFDGDVFGGMGHFEFRKDKLAFFVDAMGAVIEEEGKGKILGDRVDVKVDLDFDMVAVEFGAAYRVLERGRFMLEALGGLRYTYAYSKFADKVGNRGGSIDGSADIFDPILGARGAVQLVENWSLVCRGDVGGFGAGSKLAWSILGGVRWNTPWTPFAAGTSLFAGYKAYDIDYETGSGNSKREFDLLMHGMAMGMTFAF